MLKLIMLMGKKMFIILRSKKFVNQYFAVTCIFRRAFINRENLWRLIIDRVVIFIGTCIYEYLILNKGPDQF